MLYACQLCLRFLNKGEHLTLSESLGKLMGGRTTRIYWTKAERLVINSDDVTGICGFIVSSSLLLFFASCWNCIGKDSVSGLSIL